MNLIRDIGKHRGLIENFLSLSVLKAANYLLPLITLPYLVRVLGAEKFGLVSFAQAFMLYMMVLTDYGFNPTITREISVYRDDREKIAEIFTSTMVLKFLLLLLSAAICTIVVYSSERFSSDWMVYLFSFGMVVGNFLFPVWVFQGIERMKYIAFLNILARGIFTVLIFTVIREETDYVYVPLVISLGFIISGIVAQFVVRYVLGIRFKPSLLTMNNLRRYLYEGFYVFASQIGSTILFAGPTFFIGMALNYTVVGYYTAADKIVKAFRDIVLIFSQTVYPKLSQAANRNDGSYYGSFKKIAGIILISAVMLFITLVLGSGKLIHLAFGEEFASSIAILRLLSFSVVLYGLMNLSGLLSMIVLRYSKEFAYSQIVPISMFLVLSPLVLRYFPLYAYLLFFLFVQMLIVIFRSMYLYRRGFFSLLREKSG